MDPDELIKYWQEIYDAAKQRALALGPIDEAEEEDDPFDNEEREMWDYTNIVPNAEGDLPQFPKGVVFKRKSFNWLPWGTTKFSKIELRHEHAGLEDNQRIQITVPVEALSETDCLTFSCSMAEQYRPRCLNSYRPEDDDKGSRHKEEKRQESDGTKSRSTSLHPLDMEHDLDNDSELDRERENRSEPVGQVNKIGEDNLTADHTPSIAKSGHKNRHSPSSMQPGSGSLVDHVPDEVLKNVGEVAAKMDAYKKICQDIAVAHKREFDSLRTEFEHLRDDMNMNTYRTEELTKHFKASTSSMFKQFDTIEVLQQQASDSAYLLKHILLRVHNKSMTLDNYYQMINELLIGALTTIAQKVDKLDPRFMALKSEIQNMFHHWNSISPTAAHDGAWVAEITNLIAKKKASFTKVDTNPRATPLKLKRKGEEPEPSGLGSGSPAKKSNVEKCSSDGKHPNTESRRK
ncbi:hypothetical protein BS47DRAFT_1397543 [Hydnum rufescens UP504]|uniref:Uncharacterized protein n=1 Tax=Hydnum rufescens UP504 TaxID=1448309 RepID=A0A9P6AMY5_9AGAM|nr:hypothetical protein BS47DRAFT_1397543 [Hydnum rufescens UP504]